MAEVNKGFGGQPKQKKPQGRKRRSDRNVIPGGRSDGWIEERCDVGNVKDLRELPVKQRKIGELSRELMFDGQGKINIQLTEANDVRAPPYNVDCDADGRNAHANVPRKQSNVSASNPSNTSVSANARKQSNVSSNVNVSYQSNFKHCVNVSKQSNVSAVPATVQCQCRASNSLMSITMSMSANSPMSVTMSISVNSPMSVTMSISVNSPMSATISMTVICPVISSHQLYPTRQH